MGCLRRPLFPVGVQPVQQDVLRKRGRWRKRVFIRTETADAGRMGWRTGGGLAADNVGLFDDCHSGYSGSMIDSVFS